MRDDCPLCLAVRSPATQRDRTPHENTPLKVSASFVLLPSVGPLVPGHAIIVSRQHSLSLAAMGTDAVREYEEFVREIRRGEADWLEAEHGATADDRSGACVTHTHVHLIPGMARFDEIFDDVIPELYRGDRLAFPTGNVPYLLLRGGRLTRVFVATDLPSQLLRQTICSALARDDWDWRSLPRDHMLAETIEFWRQRG